MRYVVAWAIISVVVSVIAAQFCRAGRDDDGV